MSTTSAVCLKKARADFWEDDVSSTSIAQKTMKKQILSRCRVNVKDFILGI